MLHFEIMFTLGIIAFCLIASCVLIYKYYKGHFYAWMINFPQPEFRISVEKNVMLEMKDGVKLAADVYTPSKPGKYPVLLIRTPYDKEGNLHPYKMLGELFTSRGYVFVVQDVRGKYASEGDFYPYIHEALDGVVTLEWVGKASWSNGKVGMLGFSYMGSCAWLAAPFQSPYLKTIIPLFTSQNTYATWIDSGIPYLKGALFWMARFGGRRENEKITHKGFAPFLWHLPVDKADFEATGEKMPFYRQIMNNLVPNDFWKEIEVNEYENFDLPVLFFGGWYDTISTKMLDDYEKLTKQKKSPIKLIMGPWAHNPQQKFKDIDFGENARFSPYLNVVLNWCDYWLKGDKKNKLPANATYFLMGRNEWVESDSWPPEGVAYEKYYLGLLKEKHSEGIISPLPFLDEETNHYIYNPLNPGFFKGRYLLDSEGWVEPIFQDEIVAREDVLVFTTPPLEEELIITGDPRVVLYVSSEGTDTDFCVKICDLNQENKSYNITTGIIRMRYLKGLDQPELIEPHKIYKIEIPLRATAHSFKKGHSIVLQVASADFPVHVRNLNTGYSSEKTQEVKIVKQMLYTGGIYDAHLLLPVNNSLKR